MRLEFLRFVLGDVDDPDIYAAHPIYEWQQTERGKWVMSHAHDLTYHINQSPEIWGYLVTVTGILNEGPETTEYFLRWT